MPKCFFDAPQNGFRAINTAIPGYPVEKRIKIPIGLEGLNDPGPWHLKWELSAALISASAVGDDVVDAAGRNDALLDFFTRTADRVVQRIPIADNEIIDLVLVPFIGLDG